MELGLSSWQQFQSWSVTDTMNYNFKNCSNQLDVCQKCFLCTLSHSNWSLTANDLITPPSRSSFSLIKVPLSSFIIDACNPSLRQRFDLGDSRPTNAGRRNVNKHGGSLTPSVFFFFCSRRGQRARHEFRPETFSRRLFLCFLNVNQSCGATRWRSG